MSVQASLAKVISRLRIGKVSQEARHWISDGAFVDITGCAVLRGQPFAERLLSLAAITGLATQSYVNFHYRLVVPSGIIEVLPRRITSSVGVSGTVCEFHAAVNAISISGTDFGFKLFRYSPPVHRSLVS
jgi:hypothetical protein